ncbi:hypothetical protein HGB38_18815 [Nocardia gamkensis]|uniref:Nucleotidyltransferase domain-containing protein n=1 Tax=Nocardia gamkensis TaxID=352869 RepID=A0A7X6L5M9_9NOCA|nr:hypothetical protein [Nocardia gamkensis]
MLISEARAAAEDWVSRHAAGTPWFHSAHYAGSTVGVPGDSPLRPGSDIDVVVVTSSPGHGPKPGKILHRSVLLEVSYRSWERLADPAAVLSSYHLAPAFHVDSVIADPSGELRSLQRTVAESFTDIRWVRARCGGAVRHSEQFLARLSPSAPLHDQVTCWLFGTGVMAHVLLVAALRNPTVRLRYQAVRQMLGDYGMPDRYEGLLAHLCPPEFGADQAEQMVTDLAEVFDRAVDAARSPFPFSADITAHGRPIAIDAARRLLTAGEHREAVFWMIATYARCQQILEVDGSEGDRRACTQRLRAALSQIGISSYSDLAARADAVTRALPGLFRTAEDIMSANCEIIDR